MVTIGRVLTKNAKLVDKDWYFPGTLTEEEANAKASVRSQQWEVLCKNWRRTDQPLLEAFGEPFPDEPRWTSGPGNGRRKLTPEEVAEIRREGLISREELGEAMADEPLGQFIPLYAKHYEEAVTDGDLRNSSLGKLLGQMKLAVKYLPADVPAKDLNSDHFADAIESQISRVAFHKSLRADCP